MKEKLNPQEANDWRAVKEEREYNLKQGKKDICLECFKDLSTYCANVEEGGSLEFDLSKKGEVLMSKRTITVFDCRNIVKGVGHK